MFSHRAIALFYSAWRKYRYWLAEEDEEPDGFTWDRQTKIRLRMGPMRREKFDHLLPGRAGAQALRSLVRFIAGHGLACDVTLTLDRRDVPAPQLDDDAPPLLDGNIWLNAEAPRTTCVTGFSSEPPRSARGSMRLIPAH
jgi:predicted component of type VI protein secretion system